jgi:hypothetical protein
MNLTDLIKELKDIYKTRGELPIREGVTAESLLAPAAAPSGPSDAARDFQTLDALGKADQIGPVESDAARPGRRRGATESPAGA